MAGKKGRSGRKKKMKVDIKPVQQAPEVSAHKSIVENEAGDPFKAIETRLNSELPAAVQENAPAQAQEADLINKKMPEKTVRLFWNCVYKLEDGLIRRYLGLGNDVKGIFCDNDLIEAHIQPSCEMLKQYVPAKYWDNLDSKFPAAMLGFSILEAQLSILDKISEIKKENKTDNPQKPAAPAAQNNPYSNFPRREGL